MNEFNVTQVTSPRLNPSVTMYFTCESRITLNNIKFNPKVRSHLNTEGIYLSPDRFQTEETACPGFLINVHHKLVWKENLIAQMREALQTVEVAIHDPVVQRWKQQNPAADTTNVPFFTLKALMWKMRDVSANVYNIISAKKDAELLKMLLSKLGEGENTPRWIFVPTGLHLISSPALVKASLRHQNEYIDSVTAIPVEGITEPMMKQGDANNEERISRPEMNGPSLTNQSDINNLLSGLKTKQIN